MKKWLLVLIACSILASYVAADVDWKTADCPTIALQQKTFDLAQLVHSSNALVFVNDETINLTVFRQGPPFQMSGKVKNGIATELQCQTRSDATIGVTLQQAAIEQLNQSEDLVTDLSQLKENGGFKVEAYSFGAKVKVWVAEIGLLFARLSGAKTLI